MTASLAAELLGAVLAVHLEATPFNLFGLVAIPLGGWCGWASVDP